jgi:hypothetical protein
MTTAHFNESPAGPIPSLCSFCQNESDYSLEPEDPDLEPDDLAPKVCFACLRTLYWVLQYFPGDGSEVDGLVLEANQAVAVSTVEMLLQLPDRDDGGVA